MSNVDQYTGYISGGPAGGARRMEPALLHRRHQRARGIRRKFPEHRKRRGEGAEGCLFRHASVMPAGRNHLTAVCAAQGGKRMSLRVVPEHELERMGLDIDLGGEGGLPVLHHIMLEEGDGNNERHETVVVAAMSSCSSSFSSADSCSLKYPAACCSTLVFFLAVRKPGTCNRRNPALLVAKKGRANAFALP